MKIFRVGVMGVLFVAVFHVICGSTPSTVWGNDTEMAMEPVIQNGHSAKVVYAVLDPKLRYVATADVSDTVKIWDLKTGRVLRTLTCGEPREDGSYRGMKQPLAIDPDGRLLACVGQDGKIRIWSPETGEQINTLPALRSTTMVAMGREGRPLISTGGRVMLFWDISSQKPMHKVLSQARSLMIDPTGQHISLGFGDGTIHVRNLATRKLMGTLKGESGTVLGLAMDAESRYLVSGNADSTIDIWNLADGKKMATSGDPVKKAVRNLKPVPLVMSPSGKYVAGAGAIRTVPDGTLIRHIGRDAIPVGFDSAEKRFILFNPKGTIEIRKLDTWMKTHSFSVLSN